MNTTAGHASILNMQNRISPSSGVSNSDFASGSSEFAELRRALEAGQPTMLKMGGKRLSFGDAQQISLLENIKDLLSEQLYISKQATDASQVKDLFEKWGESNKEDIQGYSDAMFGSYQRAFTTSNAMMAASMGPMSPFFKLIEPLEEMSASFNIFSSKTKEEALFEIGSERSVIVKEMNKLATKTKLPFEAAKLLMTPSNVVMRRFKDPQQQTVALLGALFDVTRIGIGYDIAAAKQMGVTESLLHRDPMKGRTMWDKISETANAVPIVGKAFNIAEALATGKAIWGPAKALLKAGDTILRAGRFFDLGYLKDKAGGFLAGIKEHIGKKLGLVVDEEALKEAKEKAGLIKDRGVEVQDAQIESLTVLETIGVHVQKMSFMMAASLDNADIALAADAQFKERTWNTLSGKLLDETQLAAAKKDEQERLERVIETQRGDIYKWVIGEKKSGIKFIDNTLKVVKETFEPTKEQKGKDADGNEITEYVSDIKTSAELAIEASKTVGNDSVRLYKEGQIEFFEKMAEEEKQKNSAWKERLQGTMGMLNITRAAVLMDMGLGTLLTAGGDIAGAGVNIIGETAGLGVDIASEVVAQSADLAVTSLGVIPGVDMGMTSLAGDAVDATISGAGEIVQAAAAGAGDAISLGVRGIVGSGELIASGVPDLFKYALIANTAYDTFGAAKERGKYQEAIDSLKDIDMTDAETAWFSSDKARDELGAIGSDAKKSFFSTPKLLQGIEAKLKANADRDEAKQKEIEAMVEALKNPNGRLNGGPFYSVVEDNKPEVAVHQDGTIEHLTKPMVRNFPDNGYIFSNSAAHKAGLLPRLNSGDFEKAKGNLKSAPLGGYHHTPHEIDVDTYLSQIEENTRGWNFNLGGIDFTSIKDMFNNFTLPKFSINLDRFKGLFDNFTLPKFSINLDKAKTFLTDMSTYVQVLFSEFGDHLKKFGKNVKEQISLFATGVGVAFLNIKDNIAGAFEGIGTKISKTFTSMKKGITDFGSSLKKNLITDPLNNMKKKWEGAKKKWGDMKESVLGAPGRLWGKAKEAGKSLKDRLTGAETKDAAEDAAMKNKEKFETQLDAANETVHYLKNIHVLLDKRIPFKKKDNLLMSILGGVKNFIGMIAGALGLTGAASLAKSALGAGTAGIPTAKTKPLVGTKTPILSAELGGQSAPAKKGIFSTIKSAAVKVMPDSVFKAGKTVMALGRRFVGPLAAAALLVPQLWSIYNDDKLSGDEKRRQYLSILGQQGGAIAVGTAMGLIAGGGFTPAALITGIAGAAVGGMAGGWVAKQVNDYFDSRIHTKDQSAEIKKGLKAKGEEIRNNMKQPRENKGFFSSLFSSGEVEPRLGGGAFFAAMPQGKVTQKSTQSSMKSLDVAMTQVAEQATVKESQKPIVIQAPPQTQYIPIDPNAGGGREEEQKLDIIGDQIVSQLFASVPSSFLKKTQTFAYGQEIFALS